MLRGRKHVVTRRRFAPVKQQFRQPPVGGIDLPGGIGRRSGMIRGTGSARKRLIISVNILPIHRGHPRGVLRAAHAAFDLQRVHARSDDFRQDIQRAQIAPRQPGPLAPADGKRQPAGLRAAPAVPAAPADETAHQALARVRIAERAVTEALDLEPGPFPDLPDFRQRQLARRHDPRHPEALQIFRVILVRDVHLCARVDLHPRKLPADQVRGSEVLHDAAVQPGLVKRRQEIRERRQFAVLHERVHGQVDARAEQVRLVQRREDLIPGQVSGIGPRAEVRATEIHRVRARAQHRPESLIGAGGRQKLDPRSVFREGVPEPGLTVITAPGRVRLAQAAPAQDDFLPLQLFFQFLRKQGLPPEDPRNVPGSARRTYGSDRFFPHPDHLPFHLMFPVPF